MTLRVTLSIVPFGEEENERVIHTINISNLGPANPRYPGLHKYGIEVDKYKTEEYDAYVTHFRSVGPEELVFAAIDELLERRFKWPETFG